MKVLFLGGTGNISTETAALLHQRGHEVMVVSRGRTQVPPEYRAFQADRKDVSAMRTVVSEARPDAVLNFIGYEVADLQTDYDVFRDRVAQYVFISSTVVYVKPSPRLPLTEDLPQSNPWWDYAQKKIECEKWLRERWEQDRFPVTIVRPSHTYSKRWVPNPVSSASYTFTRRLELGLPVFVPDKGENPWTLTAASDFSAGVCGLLGNPATLGEAFHITSDEVLTWNEICATIAEAAGATSPQIVQVPTDFICQIAPRMTGSLKGDKSNPGVFDNSKIKRFAPGFQCKTPFREGVRASIEWLRAHPEQQNLNPEVDALCDEVVNAWRAIKSEELD
jgi:nucleoside-diphosphate-sugar epimerase